MPVTVGDYEMTACTNIYIRKDVAIGRLHALLTRLRDNLDDIFSINVLFSENELYVQIWTIAEDLPPKPEEIYNILKDLSYLVRRYEVRE